MSVSVIILAAGLGTRMRSETPKVLHRIGGAPLLAHVLATASGLAPERLVVVTGHGAEAVEADLARRAPEAVAVRQAEQRGTGDAVRCALPALDGATGDALILFGDTPLIRETTLARMAEARAAGAGLVVLGFEAADPAATYGRLIPGPEGLDRIVEWRDATPEERGARLCNSGVMLLSVDLLHRLVPRIGNANAKGEYYLTDLVALARAEGVACAAVECPEAETLGVNSRADLAAAEAAFQARRRAEALAEGVTLVAPEKEAMIGRGAKANHLASIGDAEVGEAANIGAGTITCNYDGVCKHRTGIGARAFIGSNAALVAPVRIGAEALVVAGSVITADVPDGALSVARGRQETKPGLAGRLMDRLRALKAAGTKEKA